MKTNPEFDNRYLVDKFRGGKVYSKTDKYLCPSCRKLLESWEKKKHRCLRL